jgi:hypothetical protein
MLLNMAASLIALSDDLLGVNCRIFLAGRGCLLDADADGLRDTTIFDFLPSNPVIVFVLSDINDLVGYTSSVSVFDDIVTSDDGVAVHFK